MRALPDPAKIAAQLAEIDRERAVLTARAATLRRQLRHPERTSRADENEDDYYDPDEALIDGIGAMLTTYSLRDLSEHLTETDVGWIDHAARRAWLHPRRTRAALCTPRSVQDIGRTLATQDPPLIHVDVTEDLSAAFTLHRVRYTRRARLGWVGPRGGADQVRVWDLTAAGFDRLNPQPIPNAHRTPLRAIQGGRQ